MIDCKHPKDNRLLAGLVDADWQRWQPQLERVDLSAGQVLYQPGRIPRHAYFPTGAVLAVVFGLGSSSSTEVAIVGREGMLGTSLFLGRTSTTGHASVLFAGQAFRIRAQVIRDEFDRSASVQLLLLRYTQALATEIAQTAVCNRHHSVHQQVCSWLLNSLDRLGGCEVVVTQDILASLLGVRRETVTEAARHLQAAGLIRYARGHIAVLDRDGLERQACECRAVVHKEYERLLPRGPAARTAAARPRTGSALDPAAPASGLQQVRLASTCPG